MSISALTTLAVQRERAQSGTPVQGGNAGIAAGTQAEVPQDIKDTLISAIPTEPLAAYTAAIGILAGATFASAGKYLPFRWAVFGVFLAVTGTTVLLGYRWKVNAPKTGVVPTSTGTGPRQVPVLEIIAAEVAAIAWGLAMPGSALNAQLTGNPATITAGTVAIAGAALLTLISIPLKTGSSSTTAPKSS